jgi:hypothetical protein
MRLVPVAIIAALILCCIVPCSAAVSMEINATPSQAHIGDTITLNGKVSGLKTIAVFLFVTGPDLDNRGVTLENLNSPAGRGLFTTAPVNLNDGTWEYIWDTSVILGTLKPGIHTVYVVITPIERFRYAKGEYASTQIEFSGSGLPENEVPLDPLAPVVALLAASCAGIFLMRKKK